MGTDGLRVGEEVVWEGGMAGSVEVIIGIIGGWLGWAKKLQMPLLAGQRQFVIERMLRRD